MLAYLDFCEFEGVPHVQMLRVDPSARRQGYGSALLRYLQKQYPDTEIDLGMLSQDGSKLISSLQYATITDPDIDKKMRFLARIRDHLEAMYLLSPEEIGKRSEEMNRLHDIERDLESELHGKSASKRIIEHAPVSAPLYHALEYKYAEQAIRDNRLSATSTQRFWPDGRRRKENWVDYQDSFWMKGVSLTRDLRYALRWKDITFVLDSRKLREKVKIIPFAWNYHFDDGEDSLHSRLSGGLPPDHKREREEYAIVKRTPDTYKQPDGRFDTERFRSVEGQIDGLDSFLLGIVADKVMIDPTKRWKGDKVVPALQDRDWAHNEEDLRAKHPLIFNHPKFKGFV